MTGRPILGVDPGVTGGLAFLGQDGKVIAFDIPVVDGQVDTDELVRLVEAHSPSFGVIERANAMPPGLHGRRQGVVSVFKFGQAYGALRAVVALSKIPYRLVAPTVWKKHFKLDADKEKSRALAIQLWPGAGCFNRKKDHGRAEAALLARFGAEVLIGVGWHMGKEAPEIGSSIVHAQFLEDGGA